MTASRQLFLHVVTAFAGLALGYWGLRRPPQQAPAPQARPTTLITEIQEPGTRQFTRPEERGESFAGRSPEDLIRVLHDPPDRISARKAAKALGDLPAPPALRDALATDPRVRQIVQGFLEATRSSDSDERSEARHQIQRLWHLAVPSLTVALHSSDGRIRETALASMLLMADANIARTLVDAAQNSTNPATRKLVWSGLGHFRESRPALVAGREVLDSKGRERIFNELIAPVVPLPNHAQTPNSPAQLERAATLK